MCPSLPKASTTQKEEGTGERRELLANFLKGASYSGRRYFS